LGYMNHCLFGGLATIVIVSAVGAPLPGQAQENAQNLLSSQSSPSDPFDGLSESAEPGTSADSDASITEPVEPEITTAAAANQSFDIANVLAHDLNDRQAATVYLRSLPVITFLGGEVSETASSKELTTASNGAANLADPMVQASELLSYLQELNVNSDATEIRARWDAEREAYVVSWGDQDLVTVGEGAILPDTTENPAQDALQMANRLRRLLGNAPALTEVEGMPEPPQPTYIVASSTTGMASWYGPGFHGRRSASGEVFNRNALTAAHRTLPFGTQVRVTNVSTGQQVVVRINDRGPFSHNRIIDLSEGAASSIGIRRSGVGRVRLEVLSTP
jgi:rare lipoprotein A